MKWGILATGTIAAKFAGTLVQMKKEGEDVKGCACASRSLEKAKAFAEKYEIEKAYGSYEEMLQDPEVEIVYIATPNNMHYDNIKSCLTAGKHVLCEKPFTVTKEEAEEVMALAKEKGLFMMEGIWTYHLPAMKKMQELINEGCIGEVVYARSDYGFVARGARRERKFKSDLAGGALLDIGIYNLALMRMAMNKENAIAFTSTHRLNEFGTDDFSVIQLEYSKGRNATITTCIGIDMARNAVIYGSEGSITMNDFQFCDSIKVKVDGEEEVTYNYPIKMGGFEYEIREVQNCIAQGKTESETVPHQETLALLESMLDIRASWGMKFACEN